MHVALIFASMLAASSLSGDPILDSNQGLAFSRELFWLNRMGALEGMERAAFIVDRGDGTLGCLAWPPTYQHKKATFKGALPAGVVAIIHTHPAGTPLPSYEDMLAAHRLGVTIYALTPVTIWKAVPSSFQPVIVHRGQWLGKATGSSQCKLLR